MACNRCLVWSLHWILQDGVENEQSTRQAIHAWLGATWHKQEHLEVLVENTGAVRAGRLSIKSFHMIPVVFPGSMAAISRSKKSPASGDDESGLPGRTVLRFPALQVDKQH